MDRREIGVRLPYLRAWRLRALKKQLDLAKEAHVARSTVIRAERGESIAIDNARAIAAALGVTPEQLREDPEAKGKPAP